MHHPMVVLCCLWFLQSAVSWVGPAKQPDAKADEPRIEESLEVGLVPADFPVEFCLLTHGDRQYVAYYDEARRMTVACRDLRSDRWKYQTLPSRVKWDSHNYVTMVADDQGHIHLSGNMHAAPLVYFRTAAPGDITTFERFQRMTGEKEDRCTYPRFMRGPDGVLLFHYRDGSSGKGNEIFNAYDARTKTWRRYLDRPLFDGLGEMSAYLWGPSRGPDGRYHLCWVWRDTGDCQTNHDPSYARSDDLIHWNSALGTPLELPITPHARETVVDAVPVKGGVINGSQGVGFDSKNRPVVSYHKFDEEGRTQAYVARVDGGRWVTRRVSRWDYRWEFKRGGAIPFEIQLGTVKRHGKGRLALAYRHVKHGKGLLVFDEETFEPLGAEPAPRRYPAALESPKSTFEGMEVRWASDSGKSGNTSSRYVLRWETLPANRDRARTGNLPEPVMLGLYRLSSD